VTESFLLPPDLGSGAVLEYRAYIIDADGHIVEAVPMVCVDDAEATKKAKRLVDGRDVELWQRARKIVRFEHLISKPAE
jgi:hypothetical protein